MKLLGKLKDAAARILKKYFKNLRNAKGISLFTLSMCGGAFLWILAIIDSISKNYYFFALLGIVNVIIFLILILSE